MLSDLWKHASSRWQSLCHDLAAMGTQSATANSYPFPGPTGSAAFILHHGSLVVSMRRVMDILYREARPIPATILPTLASDDKAFKAWRQMIGQGSVTNGGLRFAFWLRSAPAMHRAASHVFHCPLCSAPCCSWGEHLSLDCPLSAAAVLRGMRAIALHLHRKQWGVTWTTPASFTAIGPDGSPCLWRLIRDTDLASAPLATWEAAVTWSGLLWVRDPSHLAVPLRSELTCNFLNAIDSWLQATPCWRWECLSSPTNPSLDPHAAIGPVPILSTLLLWLLRLPPSALTGPVATSVAHSNGPPHWKPAVLLNCGSLLPPLGTARPLAVSIFQPPPPALPPGLQLLRLASDLCLTFPNAHLSPIIRRTLDTLFPPAPEHQHQYTRYHFQLYTLW